MWKRDDEALQARRPRTAAASPSAAAIDPEYHLAQLRLYHQANESQFILLFSDACGNVTVNSSQAFEPYDDEWIPENVRQQAARIARKAAESRRNSGGRRVGGVDPSKSTGKKLLKPPGSSKSDQTGRCVKSERDSRDSGDAESRTARSLQKVKKRSASTASQENGAVARKRKSIPRREARRTSSSHEPDSTEYEPLLLSNEKAVVEFLETRFRQMQQLMCKQIAKAWIKVIEPKKQSHYPYNRGEESKPGWWPEDIRHKEPDHLMKPERLKLLLTMLRCQIVPITKLEEATKEAFPSGPSGQASEERLPLLEEVYAVAKQEERFRRDEIPPTTVAYVMTSAKPVRSKPKKSRRQLSVSSSSSASSSQTVETDGLGLSQPVEEEDDRSPGTGPADHLDAREDDSPHDPDQLEIPFPVGTHQPTIQSLHQPLYDTSNYMANSPIQTSLHHDQNRFFTENHVQTSTTFSPVNYQRPQHTRLPARHSVSFDNPTPPQAPPIIRNHSVSIPQSRGSFDWTGQSLAPALASPYSSNDGQSPHWGAQRGSAPSTPGTAGPFVSMQLPIPAHSGSIAAHQQHLASPHYELSSADPRVAQHFSSSDIGAALRAEQLQHQSYTAFFEGGDASMELAGEMEERSGRLK